MTDIDSNRPKFDGHLTPYPHEEKGPDRGRSNDPVAFLKDVEQRARERQVAVETVRLLRQRVIWCYRKNGVNHYEECRKEAQDYYDVITKKDVGQLQPKWAKPEMNDGWN